MKLLLLIFLLSIPSSELSHVRQLYKVAFYDEGKTKELLDIVNNQSRDEKIYLGYRGAATIILAKHKINPFQKWNLFKDGKQMLEEAIASDTGNIELRYLRLTIQLNTPGILGYNDIIDEDKKYVTQQLGQLPDRELKMLILNYFEELN